MSRYYADNIREVVRQLREDISSYGLSMFTTGQTNSSHDNSWAMYDKKHIDDNLALLEEIATTLEN